MECRIFVRLKHNNWVNATARTLRARVLRASHSGSALPLPLCRSPTDNDSSMLRKMKSIYLESSVASLSASAVVVARRRAAHASRSALR